MDSMSLLGFAVCATGTDFTGGLSFPVGGIDRDGIPAALRRRTSQATQLAFSAAVRACRQAGRAPADLPAVFASVGGEMQVTDQLCIELAKPGGIVSPTAFHNSVHNTAAGYWTIVQGCRQAASALAAGPDTFAMGLLEAWCQLSCHGGELLLIVYDEAWPDYLAPPLGASGFAAALLLGAGNTPGGSALLGRPYPRHGDPPAAWANVIARLPAAAAIPLLEAVTVPGQSRGVPVAEAWAVDVSVS